MKKITSVALLVLFSVMCTAPSFGETGLGYETLVILPHAFTLSSWDKNSGIGVKASADFGASALSLATTIGSIAGTLGLAGLTDVNFYTFSVFKDLQQSENFRNYIKLGIFTLQGKLAGVTKSGSLPIAGIGMEWQKLWGTSLAFNADLTYPEILTLGFKTYF